LIHLELKKTVHPIFSVQRILYEYSYQVRMMQILRTNMTNNMFIDQAIQNVSTNDIKQYVSTASITVSLKKML
jgi:hypothetical protein